MKPKRTHTYKKKTTGPVVLYRKEAAQNRYRNVLVNAFVNTYCGQNVEPFAFYSTQNYIYVLCI